MTSEAGADFVVQRKDFLVDPGKYMREHRRVRVVDENGETTMRFGSLSDNHDPSDEPLFEEGRMKERELVIKRLNAEADKLASRKNPVGGLIAGCILSLIQEIEKGLPDT